MAASALSISLRGYAEKVLALVNNACSSLSEENCDETEVSNIVYSQYLNPMHDNICCIILTINQINDKDELVSGKSGPPAALMSISQLRGIYTALELFWQWGLLPKIDHLLKNRETAAYPKSIILPESLVNRIQNLIKTSPTFEQVNLRNIGELAPFLHDIEAVCTNDMFQGMMLGRNINRIVTSLLALHCCMSGGALGIETNDAGISLHAATARMNSLMKIC